LALHFRRVIILFSKSRSEIYSLAILLSKSIILLSKPSWLFIPDHVGQLEVVFFAPLVNLFHEASKFLP